MSNKVVVRFLKAWRGYSVDELAGFDPDVVDGLKARGFAEVYDGEGGGVSKQKTSKASGTKAGGAKSGGKSGVGVPPPDNSGPPPAGGEGGAGNEDGAGSTGEGGPDEDDDEKP